MDISDGASLESVDMFCYLGDMLSVDGDANAAVEATEHKGWNKFDQLVPLFTRHISLLMKGNYTDVVCIVLLLHGSET